jgi:hypothetical protein
MVYLENELSARICGKTEGCCLRNKLRKTKNEAVPATGCGGL